MVSNPTPRSMGSIWRRDSHMQKDGELRRQIMHDESQRSQEAQREEGPSAWISGHIQCLQKERTRSHQLNPEAPGKRQAPLRRQVPTGFIFRSHSSPSSSGAGEEEGGWGGSSTGLERAGSAGSEPEGLQDLTWSVPSFCSPDRAVTWAESQKGGGRSTVRTQVSQAGGHASTWPCCSQMGGTFLQALSGAPLPFPQPLNMQQ